jgi:hypothetical protein
VLRSRRPHTYAHAHSCICNSDESPSPGVSLFHKLIRRTCQAFIGTDLIGVKAKQSLSRLAPPYFSMPSPCLPRAFPVPSPCLPHAFPMPSPCFLHSNRIEARASCLSRDEMVARVWRRARVDVPVIKLIRTGWESVFPKILLITYVSLTCYITYDTYLIMLGHSIHPISLHSTRRASIGNFAFCLILSFRVVENAA